MANSISIGVAYSDPAISGGTINNTPIGATTVAAGSFAALSASGALTHTGTTAGFYGKVPVIQRPYSSALHATSGISSSADFGATQLAWAQEVQNTLIGLGVWATV